ncbi:hypothetical protein, partial [Streptosporangium canum]|uniref:hypothetical protein n=1 Tax=Streptosporangium canum TaxID=324952 RepID=UPI0033AEE590
ACLPTPPIPKPRVRPWLTPWPGSGDAATPDNAASQYGQAALEVTVFQQPGRIGHSPWRTGDPTFGVTWLAPHHGELVMRIAVSSCRM